MVVRDQTSNTMVNSESAAEIMLLMKHAASKNGSASPSKATQKMKALSNKVVQLAKKAELAAMLSKNWAVEAGKQANAALTSTQALVKKIA